MLQMTERENVMLQITEEETSRYVDTPSGRLHYNEVGEGHPIVLLHGSGPGATGWSNFAANMAHLGASFRCLAVDMPGWGKSDTVSRKDRDHVKAALDFLDALGIEKAAFIGNSMGGATSIRFSALHPERVTHLVTMGAGAGGPTLFGADGPTEGLKVLNKGYMDPSPETMMELVRIMTFDPAFATAELAEQRSRNARARQDHLDNFIAGLGQPRAHFATNEEIASIPAPSLIIHGRDDRVVHFEHSLKLVTLIKNSRLVLLNGCGHWAQLEHAEEFNYLVETFLHNN